MAPRPSRTPAEEQSHRDAVKAQLAVLAARNSKGRTSDPTYLNGPAFGKKAAKLPADVQAAVGSVVAHAPASALAAPAQAQDDNVVVDAGAGVKVKQQEQVKPTAVHSKKSKRNKLKSAKLKEKAEALDGKYVVKVKQREMKKVSKTRPPAHAAALCCTFWSPPPPLSSCSNTAQHAEEELSDDT